MASCSDKPTDNTLPENETQDPQPDPLPDPQYLFFTGADYDPSNEVIQYSYGDSLYLLALERRGNRPAYSPVWIFSIGDREVFLMDQNRSLPITFPEDYAVGLSLLPDTTGIHIWNDGSLWVFADYDTITAHYFSITLMKMVSTSVAIGNPPR